MAPEENTTTAGCVAGSTVIVAGSSGVSSRSKSSYGVKGGANSRAGGGPTPVRAGTTMSAWSRNPRWTDAGTADPTRLS